MSKYTRLNKINHYHDKVDEQQQNHHHHQQEKQENYYYNYNQHHHHRSNQKLNMPSLSVNKNNNNNNNIYFTNSSSRIKEPPNKLLLVALNRTKKISTNNNNYKVARGKSILLFNNNKEDSGRRINNNTYKNSKLAFFAFNNNYNPIFSKLTTISLVLLVTILLILTSTTKQVYSLNCYHCSSVDNPNCDESFTGKENFTLPADTDCYKHIGREAKVCRKIVQYIEHKKVVIRSCGYIDEHYSSASNGADQSQSQSSSGSSSASLEKKKDSMCYKRSGTFAIMMESCNCYTDNCNHSASLKPNQSVLFLLVSFSLIIGTILSKLMLTTTNTNKLDSR